MTSNRQRLIVSRAFEPAEGFATPGPKHRNGTRVWRIVLRPDDDAGDHAFFEAGLKPPAIVQQSPRRARCYVGQVNDRRFSSTGQICCKTIVDAGQPNRTCRDVISREPISGCERFLDLDATHSNFPISHAISDRKKRCAELPSRILRSSLPTVLNADCPKHKSMFRRNECCGLF